MSNPLQIGITGGIGSGKTLVSKIFACLGIPVYDADSHAKELMTTDGILVSAIKKEFGDLAYNPDGSLDRVYLAQNVFHDQQKLDKLNSLVHPRVKHNYDAWVNRCKEYRQNMFCLEFPRTLAPKEIMVLVEPIRCGFLSCNVS